MEDLQRLPTPALIEHIEARFHEGHRRDLPPLVARARLEAPALAQALEALARALEDHMFKEEARLFPMMAQGGHGMLALLIDDIEVEHRAHEAALAALRPALRALPDDAPLRRGTEAFLAELQAHVQAEDELLFPRFPRGVDGRRYAP